MSLEILQIGCVRTTLGWMQGKFVVSTMYSQERAIVYIIILTLTKRQTRADDRPKNVTKCSKMSTFWNFVNIFGITIKNALK